MKPPCLNYLPCFQTNGEGSSWPGLQPWEGDPYLDGLNLFDLDARTIRSTGFELTMPGTPVGGGITFDPETGRPIQTLSFGVGVQVPGVGGASFGVGTYWNGPDDYGYIVGRTTVYGDQVVQTGITYNTSWIGDLYGRVNAAIEQRALEQFHRYRSNPDGKELLPDIDIGKLPPTPCFAGKTPILMSDGSKKPIEEIEVGDEVASFSGLDAIEGGSVTETFKKTSAQLFDLNGTGVTDNHPFLMPDGSFKALGELVKGKDSLVLASGEIVPFSGATPVAGTHDVFNFTVERLHTYIAGGYRVHNECQFLIGKDGKMIPVDTDKNIDPGRTNNPKDVSTNKMSLGFKASDETYTKVDVKTEYHSKDTTFDNKTTSKEGDTYSEKTVNETKADGTTAAKTVQTKSGSTAPYPTGNSYNGKPIYTWGEKEAQKGTTNSYSDTKSTGSSKKSDSSNKSDGSGSGSSKNSASSKSDGSGSGSSQNSASYDKTSSKSDTGKSSPKPILLDLDGDGDVDLESIVTSVAQFDIDNDGFEERMTWIGADSETGQVEDGFLVADMDGDGDISSSELAFAHLTEDPIDTDLEAFSTLFDSNSDGSVNAQDADWSKLRVWVDGDRDGEVDAGELRTLADEGITSIDVDQETGDWVPVEEMNLAQLAQFGARASDIGIISSPGTGDRLAAFLPEGAVLYGVTRFTINGETRLAADMGLLHDADGYQSTTDANGNTVVTREAGGAVLDVTGSVGVSVNLAADGYDAAYGGDGADTIAVGHSDDSYGGAVVTGGGGDDSLTGAAGSDVISGGDGADSIDAGDGDDVLFIDAEDLAGGSISGGAGIDTAYVSGWQDGDAGVALTLSDHDLEALIGSGGSDTLSAGSVSLDDKGDPIGMSISGADGDDVVSGGDGDDLLSGDAGDDELTGGAGDDALLGGSGADSLAGGADNDVLDGGLDSDTLDGGDGDDTLFLSYGDDTVTGGAGADVFVYRPGDGDDVITDFQPGVDRIELFMIAAADVTITADGLDTLVTIELVDAADTIRIIGVAPGSLQASDILYGFVDGTDGSDASLSGDAMDNVIAGKDGDDVISAGDGDDFILAGAGNDTVDGGAGVDVVTGEAGDDSLSGGTGNDELDGGADNDTLEGGAGEDYLVGSSGRDSLRGGDDADALFGDSGHDTLKGDAGDDMLDGGAGNDSITGNAGEDALIGGDGNDTLEGGSEDDRLSGGDGDDVLSGGSDNDELVGGRGDDTLTGGSGADIYTFATASGDDVITDFEPGIDRIDLWHADAATVTVTADGADAVVDTGDCKLRVQGASVAAVVAALNYVHQTGSAGADNLTGHDGINLLLGEGGADVLSGQGGDDDLAGGGGADTLDGGDGADRLEGGGGNDSLTGGAGSDGFVFEVNGGDDVVTDFVSGEDVLIFRGLSRDDLTIETDPSNGANTRIAFSGGTVTLMGVTASAVAETDLAFVETDFENWTDYLAGSLTADSIVGGYGDDALFGDAGDDTLEGNQDNDLLEGELGNDQLSGGEGDDGLVGGRGADLLDGGEGNDLLQGGRDDDTLTGGEGADVYSFVEGDGQDTITDFDAVNDILSFIVDDPSSITVSTPGGNTLVTYGSGPDQVTLSGVSLPNLMTSGRLQVLWTGSDSADNQAGTSAVDFMSGAEGDDTLQGMDGNDGLEGDQGDDVLSGNLGDDSLYGGAGNDDLSGGEGNDVVSGGAGNDTMTGGAGADLFLVGDGGGHDVITDFEVGVDVVDFGEFGVGDVTVQQVGADTEITFGDNTVILQGINKNNLTESDLRYFWVPTGYGDDLAFGGPGADFVEGFEGGDVIDGGSGNDTLHGDQAAGDDSWLLIIRASGEHYQGAPMMEVSIDGVVYASVEVAEVYGQDEPGLYGFRVNGDLDPDELRIKFTNDAYGGTPETDRNLIVHEVLIEDQTVDVSAITTAPSGDQSGDEFAKLWTDTEAMSVDLSGIDPNRDDVLLGGQGNDILVGGSGNDRLVGGDDDDTMTGGAGADTFVFAGEHGDDVIEDFEEGVDVLQLELATLEGFSFEALGGTTRIVHSSGSIQLIGSIWSIFPADGSLQISLDGKGIDDVLVGTDLADEITAPGGSSVAIEGLDGDDTLNGDFLSSMHTAYGVFGDDFIWGHAGHDVVVGDASNSFFNHSVGGNDTIDGGEGADVLWGDTANDLNNTSEGGNDSLTGGFGNDTMSGDAGDLLRQGTRGGDDIAIGGQGDDMLTGDAGNMLLEEAIGGNDTLFGDDGNDTIAGDAGTYLYNNSRGGDDLIDGGANADYLAGDAVLRLSYTSIGGDDTLIGGAGADSIFGDAGEGLNQSAIGGSDVIYGGDGNDSISGDANVDIFGLSHAGDDRLHGGLGNDTMSGDAGRNATEESEAGHDLLLGGDGHDLLSGDAGWRLSASSIGGADTLYGDGGSDTISGDAGEHIDYGAVAGNDLIDGGSGDDVISGDAGQVMQLNSGGISGSDIIDGGSGNDTIAGDAGTYLRGDTRGGDDIVDGGEGDDLISGDAIVALAQYSIGGNDRLLGGAGHDTIYGDAPVIIGSNPIGGDDTLVGGDGDDELWGNSGADIYVFDAGSGSDTINDFEQGADLIRLNQPGLSFDLLTIIDNGDHRLVQVGSDSIAVFGLAAGAPLAASDFEFPNAGTTPPIGSPTAIGLDNASVAENLAGAVIGTLTVSDPDAGDSHIFAVDDTRFEVVDSQLKLKAGESLDHEAAATVSVVVIATDAGGLLIAENFDISVTDVNEAPTSIALDNSSVDENAAGAVIGTLTVTDPDAVDSRVFAVDDGRFEVVSGQLKLKADEALDHEVEATISVTVTATDTGGLSISEVFNILVTDVNEAPTAIALNNLAVSENQVGAVVGTLTVTDPDDGDSHGFTVSDNRFEVVGGQLKLRSGVSLDGTSEPSVNVTVTATDSGGRPVDEEFTISVGSTPVVIPSPTLEGERTIALDVSAILESAAAGTTIGQLSVADDDPTNSFTYQVVADSRFEISGGALKLRSDISLTELAGSQIEVEIRATDSLGVPRVETVVIYIVDELNIGSQATDRTSGQADSVSGVFGLGGADTIAGDIYGHSTSSGWVGSEDIVSGGNGNDHVAGDTWRRMLGDARGGDDTVYGGDGNDVVRGDAGWDLLDNSVGGNDVVRGDAGNDTLTGDAGAWVKNNAQGGNDTLYGGADDDRLSGDGGWGLHGTARGGDDLLYGGTGNDSLYGDSPSVASTAIGGDDVLIGGEGDDQLWGNSGADIFAFTDGDGADTIHDFEQGTDLIRIERSGVGFDDLAITDNGSYRTVQIGLDSVAVYGLATGVALTAADFEFSDAPSAPPSNQAPTAIALDNASVDENATGAVIGTLTVTDPDAGDTHSFTVNDSRFEVVAGQLKLKSGQALDYEAASTVSVIVTATDTGALSVNATFNVLVTDVDEGAPPPVTTITGTSAAETLVGTVSGPEEIYGLAGGDSIFGDGDGGLSAAGSHDTLDGGDGGDGLNGDSASLSGSAVGGNDSILGGLGFDTINGDAGTLLDSAQGGNDTIHGQDDGDYLFGDAEELYDSSSGGDDLIYGEGGGDWLIGDAGWYQYGASQGGNDTLDGGLGSDDIDGDAWVLNEASKGGNDVIYGGDGADRIRGDAWDMNGTSQGGDDLIYGGSGADAIYGDTRSLAVGAQGGNDTLIGGEGDDQLWGNSGADIFAFMDGDGADTINDFEQGVDLIRFDQTGLNFSDLVITDQGNHRLVQYGANVIAVYGLQIGASLTAADILFQ